MDAGALPRPTSRTWIENHAQPEPASVAGCASCGGASEPPAATKVLKPPQPPAEFQKNVRGAPDSAIDPNGRAGTYVAPVEALGLVKNAWKKVLRFERRTNGGQPLDEATRTKLFDGFMSRNLTQFGPERATRKDGHRMFILDDFYAANTDIPDYIKQRVTIDHHHDLFTHAEGPQVTSGMQVLRRAAAGDERVLGDPEGRARIFWNSGNVNDGASDASFFLKNAARFRDDPAALQRATEVSNWIDNKNFMKVPLVDAQIPPGSDMEAALATMRVNDRATIQTGTFAADRLAFPTPTGAVAIVPHEKVTAAVADAHPQLDRIFFDKTSEGDAFRAKLAKEQLDVIRDDLQFVDRGLVDVGSYGGEPSGVLMFDSTAINAKNQGQLAAWRAVPEKAMRLEQDGSGRKVVRSIDFSEGGADDLGPKTKYFIGTLGAKDSLQPLAPMLREAEVEARLRLMAKVKDDEAKVKVLEKEIETLRTSGAPVVSKGDGLLFVSGGSRMSKEDMVAFVQKPEVRRILESRPEPNAPPPPPEPAGCATCGPKDSHRAVGHEPVPEAVRNATREDVAAWRAAKDENWTAYRNASWASRSRSPLPERAQRNPEIVRTFQTADGPYTQVRFAGRQNLDPANNLVQPLPGVTDVIIHGNGSSGVKGLQVERFPGRREAHDLKDAEAPMKDWQLRISKIDPADGGQRVEPEHLAEVLRRMGIKGDVPLISCYGAKDTTDAGTAVRFAKAWSQNGERVYAYPGAVQNDTLDGSIFTPRQVIDPFTGEPVMNERTMLPKVVRGDPKLTAIDVNGDDVVVSTPSPDEIAARAGR